MKLIGFSIAKDNIALERGADYFDLHNNFDFKGISYALEDRTLTLSWLRGTGDWIRDTEPTDLHLVFSKVHLLRAEQRDPEMPFTEDDCLEFLGFIWEDMLEDMSSYTSNQPKSGCEHFIVRFMSAFSIKVGAESVALRVGGA